MLGREARVEIQRAITESLHCYSSSLYAEHLKASLGIPAGNSGHHKSVIAVNLELTWQYPLSEFRAKKRKQFVEISFTFYHGLLCQSVRLHHSRSTNCYAHVSLSTSFQLVSCPDPTLSRGKGSGDH